MTGSVGPLTDQEILEQANAGPQDPKNEVYHGVTIGVPTFGKVSVMWSMSQIGLGIPIFTNMGYHFVQGKPVDVARNEIALGALNSGQDYVFFRDDDTIVPREALSKLMKRLPMDQRTNPKELGNMVVGGVVYSKTEPPVPMIHIEGHSGGFEDWEFGQLVECDIIGMGCTLIPAAIFKKTLPFIRRWVCPSSPTVCPVHWQNEYDHTGELIQEPQKVSQYTEKLPSLFCPACKTPLIPMWFKTLREYDDEGVTSQQTEDAYFLLMAKKAGVKVYTDCSVQCSHEAFNPDPQLSEYYYFSPDLNMPVKQVGEIVTFLPTPENDPKNTVIKKKDILAARNGKKPKDVKFNLGSGGVNKKGYVNMDMTSECDFPADARNLFAAIERFGKPTEIHASHLLEHIPRAQVVPTFRHWLKCLQPGGALVLEVPDALWAAEEFLKDSKNGKDSWGEAVLFGAQRYPGDEHLTPLFEAKLKRIVASCKGLIKESSVRTLFPKNSNQQVVRVKVIKK